MYSCLFRFNIRITEWGTLHDVFFMWRCTWTGLWPTGLDCWQQYQNCSMFAFVIADRSSRPGILKFSRRSTLKMTVCTKWLHTYVSITLAFMIYIFFVHPLISSSPLLSLGLQAGEGCKLFYIGYIDTGMCSTKGYDFQAVFLGNWIWSFTFFVWKWETPFFVWKCFVPRSETGCRI